MLLMLPCVLKGVGALEKRRERADRFFERFVEARELARESS